MLWLMRDIVILRDPRNFAVFRNRKKSTSVNYQYMLRLTIRLCVYLTFQWGILPDVSVFRVWLSTSSRLSCSPSWQWKVSDFPFPDFTGLRS